jgi:hypothetical protein
MSDLINADLWAAQQRAARAIAAAGPDLRARIARAAIDSDLQAQIGAIHGLLADQAHALTLLLDAAILEAQTVPPQP